MPKPVKKAVKKAAKKKPSGLLPVPPKPKRSADPMKAARAILDEHMGRVEPPPVLSFEEQYRKHMAKLGAKGGKIGGKRSLETMTLAQRKARSSKAGKAAALARAAKQTP